MQQKKIENSGIKKRVAFYTIYTKVASQTQLFPIVTKRHGV